jgi:hypothetical protein
MPVELVFGDDGTGPEGDNSPMLYAGGLAILGATAFT